MTAWRGWGVGGVVTADNGDPGRQSDLSRGRERLIKCWLIFFLKWLDLTGGN